MRNIKLTIEYEGTNYSGWQIQRKTQNAKRRTIQELIEKILCKILQERIKIIGSGRTDAGVHALGQVANFKTNSKIPLEKLQKALNALLPQDIVVNKIEEVDFDFHSRFQAKSKLYRYLILNSSCPSVFLRRQSYFYPYPLDVNLMRKELKCLLGRHDFKSFQASDKKERNSIKEIKQIKIKREKGLIAIDVEADGFLYNMVRNIVGTVIEIGRGRFPKASMKKILSSRDRAKAGPTSPSRGLCLIRVKY